MVRFIKDIFRYGVVGVSSSLADVLVYLALTRLAGFGELFANLPAYLVGHTISFYGNRLFTFHSHNQPLREYRRFWTVTLGGFVISQSVLALGLHLGYPDLYAKGGAIVFAGLWNFLMHRFWTFRSPV